jgi:hypothetical protein
VTDKKYNTQQIICDNQHVVSIEYEYLANQLKENIDKLKVLNPVIKNAPNGGERFE